MLSVASTPFKARGLPALAIDHSITGEFGWLEVLLRFALRQAQPFGGRAMALALNETLQGRHDIGLAHQGFSHQHRLGPGRLNPVQVGALE